MLAIRSSGWGCDAKNRSTAFAWPVTEGAELLEEREHPSRVVPFCRDIGRSETIRLTFGIARKPHERTGGRHLRGNLSDAGPSSVAKNRPKHAEPKVRIRRTLHLFRSVARHDVPYFMTQHTGQRVLVLGRLDQVHGSHRCIHREGQRH